jgi:hypothetical protein
VPDGGHADRPAAAVSVVGDASIVVEIDVGPQLVGESEAI